MKNESQEAVRDNDKETQECDSWKPIILNPPPGCGPYKSPKANRDRSEPLNLWRYFMPWIF